MLMLHVDVLHVFHGVIACKSEKFGVWLGELDAIVFGLVISQGRWLVALEVQLLADRGRQRFRNFACFDCCLLSAGNFKI